MDINDLFRKLRQHGLRSQEAAAIVGYALLVRQDGWEGIAASDRRRRNIQRTLAKLGVNPHDVRLDAPGQETVAHRRWQTEGVLHSGGHG